MDYLRFYVLFNSISVISGRWADDNERLCTIETLFTIEKISASGGDGGDRTGTVRSVGQRSTH